MAERIDGLALALIGAGGLVAYAGIKGYSIPSALQALVQGKSPAGAQPANQINTTSVSSALAGTGSGSGGSGSVVSGGSPQSILQQTAAQFGWGSGAEWQALQNVEMAEAGFSPTARNASGAFGLAQALGHGTAGTACPATGINEYGGYGLSDAQAQQANCGQPGPQALWMCNYIQQRYGDPIAAWAHEQSNGWY